MKKKLIKIDKIHAIGLGCVCVGSFINSIIVLADLSSQWLLVAMSVIFSLSGVVLLSIWLVKYFRERKIKQSEKKDDANATENFH